MNVWQNLLGPVINDEEAKTEELRGMIRLHAGNESRSKERGKMMSSMLDMDEVTIEVGRPQRSSHNDDSKEDPEQIFKVVAKVHLLNNNLFVILII